MSMLECDEAASGNRKISKSGKVKMGWSGGMGGDRFQKMRRRSRWRDRRGEEWK